MKITPELAFARTLQKWKDIAAGTAGKSGYASMPHLNQCGFCEFDDALDAVNCGGCPGLRHFEVEDCLNDIPEIARMQEIAHLDGGIETDYYAAAAEVVTLLEKNKDGLIAAGHAILKEIEDG